ncbi:hypothetical protein JX266_013338 [Neoarthrinium moseri]|nr:hypothetical protein JX266_013338 [Neoarthrinium moseri]
MTEHAVGNNHGTAETSHGSLVMSVPRKANFDWLGDAPPENITDFQKFVRSVDWENSSIGPMSTWCRELKQMVRFAVTDTSPVILYWGDTFTIVYNEAYIPLVGAKHPGMLGKDATDVFPEFWSYFDKLITEQRSTGETLVGEASMLLMERRGFMEETYFDWKLVPIIADDGEVKGSYSCPSDHTWDVINLRRTTCIKSLAQKIAKTSSLDELWKATLSGLECNEKDLPFVLLYTAIKQTGLSALPSRPHVTCHLEGSIGVHAGHAIARTYMDAQHDLKGFAPKVLEAMVDGEMLKMEANDPSLKDLMDGIEWRGFGLPSHEFVIVPLKADDETVAFFIVGLNPYRRYNQRYREFLQLIVEVLVPQISKIKLSEEVQRRAEIATKATLDFEQSEARFSRFADRSTIGLAVAGRDRNVIYANDSWYRFAGIDPSTKDYGAWIDSVYEEDIPLVLEWWTRVFEEKKGGHFQYRSKVPFRQGNMHSEQRTAICAVYPDLDHNGEIESIMGFVIDISELKWTEDQLRIRTQELEASEGKYRNFAEHCPLGIVRTDGKGYVQYGNDAWHAYFGFVRGQLTGPQPWLPFIDEPYLDGWNECFESFQRDPGPRTMELKLKDKLYTIKDGEHVMENGMYILVTGFAEFDRDGTVRHIDFWVTGYISAQKMAAKVLADKMDEAIQLKTHQERFIDMISHEIRNPLSAVLHCGEEVIGAMKTCLENLECPRHLSSVDGCANTGTFRQQILSTLDAANTIMYCVQHQKQIVDDVLTLSKLDADLLVVSPVPIQPMSLVRSAMKVFNPELKMTDITLSVIEDASLSALRVNWVLLDPNRFLQIVINLVTNAIKFTRTSSTKKIDITVSASHEPPVEGALGVHFVPRRYNTAKPTSPTTADGPERFDVAGDLYLSFTVRDTGKGLTNDEKALLFNRFSQASPKTHIEYGGSGLGLFISRQITEMLGGEIGMNSEGDGCTFAFYVKAMKASPPRRPSVTVEPILQLTRTLSLTSSASPLVVPSGANDPASIGVTLVTPEGRPASAPSERHVLVIEDNLVNQKILCKLLRNRSFVVEAANHGQEALEAIKQISATGRQGFEVILCDIEMPVMGGIEFAKEVRFRECKGHMPGHIPIIGVTANVRGQQVSAAIEAGMDGVTTKPYRIDDLIAHINRVCYGSANQGPGHQQIQLHE